MKIKKTIFLSFFLMTILSTGILINKPAMGSSGNNGITVYLDTGAVYFGNGTVVHDPKLADQIKEHAADISWVTDSTVLILHGVSGPSGHPNVEIACAWGTGEKCPQPSGNGPGDNGDRPDGDRPGGPVTGFVGGGGKEKGDSTPTGHVTGQVTGLAEDQNFEGDGGQPDETGSEPPADCAPNCGDELPNPDGDDDGGPAKRQGYAAQPTDEGTGGPTGPAARQGLFAHPIDGNGDPLSRTGAGVRQGIKESPIGDGDGNGSPIYRQNSGGRSITQQVLEVFGF